MEMKAIYPGSFDPVTNGHLDIVERAGKVFTNIIIAVSNRSVKSYTFSLTERVDMVKKSTKNKAFVEVISFEGLLVDLAKKLKCFTVIRGLRAISDFEYEFQMALMNRSLDSKIETMFLMPDEKYTYLSSSLIKEIASMSERIEEFIPKDILNLVSNKLKNK
ncbi:MAG: pantetheine-phosphate adenylyltransferase [bacterium]